MCDTGRLELFTPQILHGTRCNPLRTRLYDCQRHHWIGGKALVEARSGRDHSERPQCGEVCGFARVPEQACDRQREDSPLRARPLLRVSCLITFWLVLSLKLIKQ